MNGGGGGGGDGGGSGPDRHGMITLEDLESFSEDQLSDSGNGSLEEEGETMEEDEDPNRQLHYWQDVARGHQVEVSQGKKKQKKKTRKTTETYNWLVSLFCPSFLLRYINFHMKCKDR